MPENEGFEGTLAHAMELWFDPEIARRQAVGVAPNSYSLRAAQVIIFPDERPHLVRLNEEVRLISEAKLAAGVSKAIGDPISFDDIESLVSFRLPPTEDPNCGHLTIVRFGESWYLTFDFRYNRERIRQVLAAAQEFYETASEAARYGRKRAAVDNLFSAAELAAKAYLLSTPTGEPVPKSHGHIHSRFNRFTRHGDVDAAHRRSFNVLSEQRSKARYGAEVPDHSDDQIGEWLRGVEALLASVRARGGCDVNG